MPAFPKKPWPVTLRQVMGHVAGVTSDGGDEGPLFGEHCGRPVDALQHFAEESLRFEPGTEYRYSRYGWILVSAAVEAAAEEPFFTVHAEARLRAAGHERHDERTPRTAAGPGLEASCILSEVRGGSPLRSGRDAGASTTRATRDPARSCPPRPTWSATRWPSTAASCCSPRPSNCSRRHSGCDRARRRATGLAGTSRPSRWRGRTRARSATTGTLLGGMVASLMTFPEHGIVVAVTSNISYADTFAVGSKIAQAFADHGKRPARSQ